MSYNFNMLYILNYYFLKKEAFIKKITQTFV